MGEFDSSYSPIYGGTMYCTTSILTGDYSNNCSIPSKGPWECTDLSSVCQPPTTSPTTDPTADPANNPTVQPTSNPTDDSTEKDNGDISMSLRDQRLHIIFTIAVFGIILP